MVSAISTAEIAKQGYLCVGGCYGQKHNNPESHPIRTGISLSSHPQEPIPGATPGSNQRADLSLSQPQIPSKRSYDTCREEVATILRRGELKGKEATDSHAWGRAQKGSGVSRGQHYTPAPHTHTHTAAHSLDKFCDRNRGVSYETPPPRSRRTEGGVC